MKPRAVLTAGEAGELRAGSLRAGRDFQLARREAVPKARRAGGVNQLLQSLPASDRRRVLAACETVVLTRAEVIYSPGQQLRDVYFPVDGYISLVMTVDEVASLEVALIGNEGMLGVHLILGVGVSPLRAVVQGAGFALRMRSADFLRELERSSALHREIGRYACVRLAQLARMSACTRFHLVQGRLARSLLMTQDRARTDTVHVTHELLAFMLGVRRVGITKAASSLQKRGLIRYSRGDITILDRPGLKAASCGCYRADRETYEGLLGYPRPDFLPG